MNWLRLLQTFTFFTYINSVCNEIICNSTQVADDNFDVTQHRNWHLLPHEECGNSAILNRITGGIDASLGQYPWMARVGYINKNKPAEKAVFRCGAAIISKDYVITAAHCVSKLPRILYVGLIRLGEYNVETNIDCVTNICADQVIDIKPKYILTHKKYGVPEATNDIALIRLSKSIQFTVWISPICLPFGELLTKNFEGQVGEVAGWGYYQLSVTVGSTILQTVSLPFLDIEECRKSFQSLEINDTLQICVGGEIGKDSCNGDSGGPLMKVEAVNGTPRYFILGVVSLGAKYCGLAATPAIYTKLTSYLKWILNNLRN